MQYNHKGISFEGNYKEELAVDIFCCYYKMQLKLAINSRIVLFQ